MQGGRTVTRRGIATLMALAAALAAGLLAGCGVAATAHATATATVTTATTGTQTSTYTQPPVKIDPSTTTIPADQLPGHGRPPVQLGDMNTPEQFILGALYGVALSQAGYTVDPTRNIGVPSLPQAALKQGTLDIYPQYLNVWNTQVAHLKTRFITVAGAYRAASAYAKRHGFELLTPTPFSNTTGFAVTTQFAREDHVTSLADLSRAPRLTFGIPLGLSGMAEAERIYGFKPAYVQTVDIGSQYGWLDSGNVQVAYVSTTDPELAQHTYTLLSDPKHVFGFNNVVPVTTPAVIKAEGPAFVRIIDQIDALLTTSAMRGLNQEIEGHDSTSIAEQFLQGNGLLPPSKYSTTS
jgi:osmoprotectant transport system substrate-binding protein